MSHSKSEEKTSDKMSIYTAQSSEPKGIQSLMQGRTLMGENISSKDYAATEIKAIKTYLTNSGAQISFEKNFEANTHGFIRNLLEKSLDKSHFFLKSKYNTLLKEKLRDSFIMPRAQPKIIHNPEE